MRVKLVEEMSGTRNGVPWPGLGEVIDLPADEAGQMLAHGHAVLPEQKHASADARFAAKQAADKLDQKAAADRRAAAVKAGAK